MKPKYAPEPRRTNEKPPALLGVVVRIGTVPAGQRLPDHQVTVRVALSLCDRDDSERRGSDKTPETCGNGQLNWGFVTVCTQVQSEDGRSACRRYGLLERWEDRFP
jgi:hypothetical protein